MPATARTGRNSEQASRSDARPSPTGGRLSMTVLVLCDAGDLSARWIEGGLQRRRVPVLHVTGMDLVGAERFGHRIGRETPKLRIRLRHGRTFTHRSVTGVINRLTYLPEPGDARVPASDREYAATEVTAITLSWMSALAAAVPFVDRPSPAWIGGEWRSPAEWALLAHAAGLVDRCPSPCRACQAFPNRRLPDRSRSYSGSSSQTAPGSRAPASPRTTRRLSARGSSASLDWQRRTRWAWASTARSRHPCRPGSGRPPDG